MPVHSRFNRVNNSGLERSPENLEKLFCLDMKSKSDGTENEKGTGLGLILCKDFIEKNGGTIRAESEAGKGSRFIISLPVRGD
jgi:signal transduction histidine kinase